jgi:ABC-2 type transport system ATP-binding protein
MDKHMASDGIHVENLAKAYQIRAVSNLFGIFRARKTTINALSGVTLNIEPGEAFGIIGPNGAGKTTLMSCLLGLVNPDEGGIKIDGLKPNTIGVRRRIGYLPERLNFDRSMSAIQFLHFHHELAGEPSANRKSDSDNLLNKVELSTQSWNLSISRFSRGMLQRLGLAQALIGKPRYLFLDEPGSGLDPAGVILMRKILLEEKQNGMTIVLNSHQLDQIEKLCDRVALIRKGKLEVVETLAMREPGSLERFFINEAAQE